MPSVRIILTLPVADETEAASTVAALEAQFPDQAIPAQYTSELDGQSTSLTQARANLASKGTTT
jgi:hypothetical protein